jgi:para-aminobenzoate synthetase component 1
MKPSEWLDHPGGVEKINALGKRREPFLFVISYDKNYIFAQPLRALDKDIFYKIEEWRNCPAIQNKTKSYRLSLSPVTFQAYQETLEKILEEIRSGNTYLLNLTFRTPIQTNLSLKEIFVYAKAKFKLYFKGKFVCFSPERFVTMQGDTISAYPMKGTIEASAPDAHGQILSDPKETAEHVMIVDLMRNDLGIVGTNVEVKRFRYIDKIKAGEKELLQVSSEITAKLSEDWRDRIGEILDHLTPAGSVTGTPKRRTTQIIDENENYERGFYTGVFGIFDGDTLRSAVMIRFIEEEEGRLFYKSGGGITLDSQPQDEYQELLDKIYLPF